MTAPRILVVEDDQSLRTVLTDNLEVEGYAVTAAATGTEGRSLLQAGGFDLVVLDWMLPGKSGVDLLRELRARGDEVPVLMLTVRNEVPDRVLGLELGADDFLGKPFALQELLARIHALLRRGQRAEESTARFRLGAIDVDLDAYVLTRDGADVALSPKEAELLGYFYKRRGVVVTRGQILDGVWGRGVYVGPRTVDTHIRNLRKKIEVDPDDPRLLQTVHGVGYKLVVE